MRHCRIDSYHGDKKKKYDLIWDKAILLVKSGREEVNGVLDELISQADNPYVRANAHIQKGKLMQENDQKDDAKKWVLRAYKIEPTNEFIVSSISSFFNDTQDTKAEMYFGRKLIKLNPKGSNYWGRLGNVYLRLGLDDYAMEAYERARELAEGDGDWLIANIGNLYNNVGLHTKAIEMLQQAIELDKTSQYSHERLASSMANKDKLTTKIKTIEEEMEELLATTKMDSENN